MVVIVEADKADDTYEGRVEVAVVVVEEEAGKTIDSLRGSVGVAVVMVEAGTADIALVGSVEA